MKIQSFKELYHCTYALQYHLVIVTKYRHKCLNAAMLAQLKEVFTAQLILKEGALLEFNGEADPVHLLLELPPKIAISAAVNSLKTVTSRLLRRDHAHVLKKYYWKPVLWSRSYFVSSCGGAPLEVVKQYIQQQKSPH